MIRTTVRVPWWARAIARRRRYLAALERITRGSRR